MEYSSLFNIISNLNSNNKYAVINNMIKPYRSYGLNRLTFTSIKQTFTTENDELRLQAKMTTIPASINNFINVLSEALSNINNNIVLSKPIYLKLLKSCSRQVFHLDISPKSKVLAKQSYIIIIAIQPNTTIDIKNSYLDQPFILDIPQWSVFIANSLLIHAGSAYSKENTRIHLHADLYYRQKSPRKENTLYRPPPPIRLSRDEVTAIARSSIKYKKRKLKY